MKHCLNILCSTMRGQNPIRVGCEKETWADLLQLARCSENIYIKMRANCVISIYSLVFVHLRPVIKSTPSLSSWIYIIGRNFTSQIWGLNPGGGLVFESLCRFSTSKNRCFFIHVCIPFRFIKWILILKTTESGILFTRLL